MTTLNKLAALVFLIGPGTAWGWGDIGHGAIGYIAEQNLTPEAKNLVHQLIGFEPLAVSAVFPDDVRPDSRFAGRDFMDGFAPYHFITLPAGTTPETVPGRWAKDADTMMQVALGELLNASLSVHQRGIYLRYLAHIVGDVHQPLHIGDGTDRGGNICYANWVDPYTNKPERHNLHKIWDIKLVDNIEFEYQQLFKSGKHWFGHQELANLVLKQLVADPRGNRQKFQRANNQAFQKANQVTHPFTWYKEAQNLHPQIYPGDKKPGRRPYCRLDVEGELREGAYDPSKIPTLDAKYIKANVALVKEKILTAGYRLAGLLNRVAKDGKLAPLDPKLQTKLLKEIMPVNP